MNDYQKVKDLFTELGINMLEEGNKIIVLEVNDKKIKGYYGFYTEFIFDQDGKFIEVAILE
ncbi:MAG: hypothetical protein M0P49_03780 [Bacilli bacterium]|nr:hypothetical protein [Bacilli bacterium]